jgi:hypothetical protein
VADPPDGVHVFAEPDYLYGVGSVTMRIEQIDRASPVRYDGEIWYQVEGVQIGYNGAELGHRSVLVRARRLHRA